MNLVLYACGVIVHDCVLSVSRMAVVDDDGAGGVSQGYDRARVGHPRPYALMEVRGLTRCAHVYCMSSRRCGLFWPGCGW